LTNQDKKRLQLFRLAIKTIPENVEIKGFIDLSVLTTAQPSGCLPSGTDSCLVPFSFSEKVTK
jgi:hypothetical protein